MTIDITVHKNVLLNILKDIYTDSNIAPWLGFKGGTAVLLFYNLSRFSVDLDFDLLNETHQNQIFDTINEILKKYGTVKSRKKRYSLFFLLVYKNKAYGAQNIKVEINKRIFGSTYEVKHYLGIAMQVMVKEDIVANKLVAMHERMGSANRDIYDAWFFLSNYWPINKKIIEFRTGVPYTTFIQTCIADLDRMPDRGILAGLGELLNEKQKAWAKSKLRTDLIFLLKLLINA